MMLLWIFIHNPVGKISPVALAQETDVVKEVQRSRALKRFDQCKTAFISNWPI